MQIDSDKKNFFCGGIQLSWISDCHQNFKHGRGLNLVSFMHDFALICQMISEKVFFLYFPYAPTCMLN